MAKRDEMSGWQYMGDIDWLGYGGTWYRNVSGRRWQFIVFTNMHEVCGRDAEDGDKYNVSLREVNLDAIDPENQQRALDCCGGTEDEPSDEITAFSCSEYGCHAPIEDYSGNNARKLLREAKAEANRLREDVEALEEAMERPVNRIGSTAREFMTGDLSSALQRGVEKGEPEARLMAKTYGVDQQTIDDARPEDWMPYAMGYMAAMAGNPAEQDDPENPLAPEYHRGYERGERVRKGECPPPGWIKMGGDKS